MLQKPFTWNHASIYRSALGLACTLAATAMVSARSGTPPHAFPLSCQGPVPTFFACVESSASYKSLPDETEERDKAWAEVLDFEKDWLKWLLTDERRASGFVYTYRTSRANHAVYAIDTLRAYQKRWASDTDTPQGQRVLLRLALYGELLRRYAVAHDPRPVADPNNSGREDPHSEVQEAAETWGEVERVIKQNVPSNLYKRITSQSATWGGTPLKQVAAVRLASEALDKIQSGRPNRPGGPNPASSVERKAVLDLLGKDKKVP